MVEKPVLTNSIILILLLCSCFNNAMQSENEIAAKIRSAIAKQVTSGLYQHADYPVILNNHLKKLQECPLRKRAHNIYLMTYVGQEWSMYVPLK